MRKRILLLKPAYLRTYFLFLSFTMISDGRKTGMGAERSQDLWVDVFNSNFHSNTKFLRNKHPGIGMDWVALVCQDPFNTKAIWFLTLHSKALAVFSEKHSPHFKAASFSIFQSRLAANSKHSNNLTSSSNWGSFLGCSPFHNEVLSLEPLSPAPHCKFIVHLFVSSLLSSCKQADQFSSNLGKNISSEWASL